MAEQKKNKKPVSAAKSPSHTTVTNRATTKKGTGSGQKKPSSSNKKRPSDKSKASNAHKSEFARNYLPYILGAVCLFLAVCYVVDLFGRDVAPVDHPMGLFGYYICHALFGCLSWVAYLVPATVALLLVFWHRHFENGKIVIKVVLSAVLVVLLAAFAHVIACAVDPTMTKMLHPVDLYDTGATFTGGGVIGGYVGYALYWALRLPGTIVLMIVTVPLVLMSLVNVTPREVFGKLWKTIKNARANRANERDDHAEKNDVSYEDEEDTEDVDEEEEAIAEADTPSRGRHTDPARDTQNDRRVIHVDPETGEVLGDDGKKSRRDKRAVQDEAPISPLPLYDKTPPAADKKEDLPWGNDAEPVQTRPVAEQTQPTEDEEDTADAMQVGFDDDPEQMSDEYEAVAVPTRISGRVSYEIVTDKETTAPHTTGGPVNVRILKSETSAVDEHGLSEEEVVLPSASVEEKPVVEAREYVFPSPELLTRGPSQYETNDAEIAENTQILRDVLESFRIGVREISCSCGPTITRFEVKPDTGVRVRSIANLVDDIAMGLAKAGVRIEAPIPGKSAVGIEVPNAEPATVYFRNILETPEFRNHKSRIAACLGADVSGRPVILDINKMPHLLIAGATGTGKSVCINSLIMSILYKAKPDEVKLILIDPKKVEFAMYRDLPHLYAPVVSDPKKAAGALNSAVNEMERRFELIEEVGVRNIAGYNEITAGDPERPPLPQMVIIIDELADLMMSAPAEVETAICRLAQKARAAGIHLVIGTQRPSVDVITGLIKANVPSRIAFTVKSGVDSRTILDTVGADKLIGRGDMLYAPIGSSKPIRVQGAFVSEAEVEKVVTFIKEHNDKPTYDEAFARSIEVEAAKCGRKKGEQMSLDDFDGLGGGRNDNEDPKFWEALEVAVTKDKIGTSALQRACNLGYGRAAKIIDRMEELGFVGPDPGTKQGRKVLISKEEYLRYKMNGLPGGDQGDHDEDAF